MTHFCHQVADVDEKRKTQLKSIEFINLLTPLEWWDSRCMRCAWRAADITIHRLQLRCEWAIQFWRGIMTSWYLFWDKKRKCAWHAVVSRSVDQWKSWYLGSRWVGESENRNDPPREYIIFQSIPLHMWCEWRRRVFS